MNFWPPPPLKFSARYVDLVSRIHLWSQVRVEGEQKVAELQAVVEELNGKLGTFTQVPQTLRLSVLTLLSSPQESEKGETALQHYWEQAASSSATASRPTEELGVASSERDDFRRQLFAAKAERNDMAGLAERRQQEVERVSGEIRALTEQVGLLLFSSSLIHCDL